MEDSIPCLEIIILFLIKMMQMQQKYAIIPYDIIDSIMEDSGGNNGYKL